MITRVGVYTICFVVIAGFSGRFVWSEEESERAVQSPSKRERHRSTREKDAEGTEAKNRFEVGNLLKSQYHLDGKPLEVDTD